MDGATTTGGGPGSDLAGLILGGRYELLTAIGAGGMAVVWRARDHVLARMVAVKIVATDTGDRRIQQEAQAAAALSHPHIAHVHDYGEFYTVGQVFPYVVMELVEGGTLSQRLAEGPLTPRLAMRVCAEVAEALAAAHAAGLVHRDIKPANVMLGPTGAKVVDFGIAAATAPSGSGDLDPDVLGTPAFLAPERLIDDAVEPASDVYALGVVLYRLLSGHSPWTTEDTTQMLRNHIYVEPAPLPPVAGVPPQVADLCERCLLKDPSRRPSAREVAALLAQDTVPVERPAGPPRPKRWAVAAASLVAVGAAGVGGWLLVPGDDPRPEGSAPVVAGPSASPALPPTASSAPVRPTPSAAGLGRTTAAVAPGGSPRAAATTTAPPTATAAPAVPLPTTVTTTPPAGPGAPAPTRPAPPTTEAPSPETRAFSSTAGNLTATCSSPGTPEILSYAARKPYKVQSAEAAAVTFKHGAEVTTMTVTCAAGKPSMTMD
ncbi:serine/threonine-protein kinase [Actinoplanes sp. M2I2]|uniref:serine/threonine-protein kinase n=1 Tax=Actinoplanes sp. M2I2 TaxID=1734444 RepID=UPI00201FFCA8|nr:serine/threonine protein kinase [Actinoplanes sp. M2I2]